jgi:SAM-dependent methyltransferase
MVRHPRQALPEESARFNRSIAPARHRGFGQRFLGGGGNFPHDAQITREKLRLLTDQRNRPMSTLNVESAVKERYASGAACCEPSLCCPVDYDPQYLQIIPAEVIERDYGCGDPSKYVRPGETVLDLGSGTGKICFIASQVVGQSGKVIGVDMTDEMLEVARRNAPVVAERVGYANVEFRKGRIQDLALDLERLDEELKANPITSADSFLKAGALAEELRIKHPLIATESVDVVVSNCVLNLVEPKAKRQLFEEIFRVLRNGGRAVISDIVAEEEVPAELQADPELWSGCISGALTESGFLDAFSEAGFYGIRILKRDAEPWRTVQGFEFRSVTVEAFKGKQGPCFERNQAVIYKGPFKEVVDDDDHVMERGQRYAVCDKTFNLFKKEPYRDSFEFIEPYNEIPLSEAQPFDSNREPLRHPKESKGQDYTPTTQASSCCDSGGCC